MKHRKLIAFIGSLAALAALIVFLISPRKAASTTPPIEGTKDSKPAAAIGNETPPPLDKASKNPVPSSGASDDISRYPEVRDRLLNVFARTRAKWLSMFSGLRWNRNMYVMFPQLIDDKEFREFAASLAGEDKAGVRSALKSFCDSSQSDLGPFTLLLLAQGGHRDLEEFFLRHFKATDAKDPVLSIVAALGLAKIATPSALEPLAQEFRASLAPGGKPNWTIQNALGQAGPAGLQVLLGIGEELFQRGLTTAEDFKKVGFLFPSDPSLSEGLRQIAGSHASPAIRILALRSLVSAMRSGEDLAFVLSRAEGEADASVRAEIMKSAADSSLRNELKELDSEAKSKLARIMDGHLRSDQGLRLKVMLKLEPTAEMTLARSVMLGTPPEGVDAGKLDAILFENLPSVETEEARKLMQEYALKMGVLDCLNPLAQLGGKGGLTDERLIAPLLDLLAKSEAGKRAGQPTTALWALTGFSEASKERITAELESFYAGARKPEIRMAVLESFGRLGPRGEEILVGEARSSADFSTRLAAWNTLSKSGALDRRPDLAVAAKDFLRSTGLRPAEATRTSATNSESVHYLELFASVYLSGGVKEDLPLLREAAKNPTLPTPIPHWIEQLRSSATAAMEAIELRNRVN